MDCKKLYDENLDFKKYVDLYSAKHGIPVHEVLKHRIVKNVAIAYLGK